MMTLRDLRFRKNMDKKDWASLMAQDYDAFLEKKISELQLEFKFNRSVHYVSVRVAYIMDTPNRIKQALLRSTKSFVGQCWIITTILNRELEKWKLNLKNAVLLLRNFLPLNK